MLALAMIVLLLIAVGLRFYFIESHAFKIDDDQKTFAMNSAKNELKDEIGSSNYTTVIQNHGIAISTKDGKKRVVRVIFSLNNTTLAALVDMDTGAVVEKSRIEMSGWMKDYINDKALNINRWGHHVLFGR